MPHPIIQFVWRRRDHRTYFLAGISISIALFFLFKLLYPHPNMVMDSYVYIRPLAEGLGTNSFPIGYSWFLAVFSFFSRSTTLLVWLQYLLLEGACLLFFFTLLYFFQPARWVKILLFLFLFVNPLFLYCSNFIMSDTLFTTLSIAWCTQLMWMVARPRKYMIVVHAVLLLLVFSVRYNALYYPFVATLVLLFTRMRPWLKMAAIVLQFLFIGAFVQYTRFEMDKLSGVRQFSAFGGWKMANNALYMYGHVCQQNNDAVPARFAQVDKMVRNYFYSVRVVDDLANSPSSGGFYGGYNESPLVQYMYAQYGVDTIFQNFKKWGLIAPYYGEYGSYLVRKYPWNFVRYFIVPNAMRYAITPTEVFSSLSPYYLRTDGLGLEARQWFGLKTLAVPAAYINLRTAILSPYPILLGLTHLAFVIGLSGFILFRGFKRMSRVNAFMVFAVAIFWLSDLFFKITAGAIVLRHQLFLMILEFAFALLFMEFISTNMDAEPHYSREKVLYGGAKKRGAIV